MTTPDAIAIAEYIDARGQVTFACHANGRGQPRVNRLALSIYTPSLEHAEVLLLLLERGCITSAPGKGAAKIVKLTCAQARAVLTEVVQFTSAKRAHIEACLAKDARYVEPQL